MACSGSARILHVRLRRLQLLNAALFSLSFFRCLLVGPPSQDSVHHVDTPAFAQARIPRHSCAHFPGQFAELNIQFLLQFLLLLGFCAATDFFNLLLLFEAYV